MAGAIAPSIQVPQGLDRELPFEIRTALPEDQEEAWALQRAAFSLPDGPLPPHPGQQHDLRVVVCSGRVVSCLTLIYAELCVRGAFLPMGGVRHVATHPEEQNRGYASALMRDTLKRLHRQGVSASVLFPFSFRYYRKFGYELGGNHCQFWCRPGCIPVYAEHRECRVAGAADVLPLARFYEERGRHSACGMVRDERRWASLCADPELRVIVHGHSRLDGYAVTTEGRDSYGGRVLRVLDLTATSPRAWRALLGHLAQAPVESVEWLTCADDLTASGLLRSPAPLREGFKPRGIATVRPMFQFRVVDLESAVRSRRAAFPRGEYRLALRVYDDLLGGDAPALLVRGEEDRVEIERAGPGDPWLEMDVRIFSQIFCGYMSAGEAVSQDLARCSSPEAVEVAEQLFPAGDPFIAELDRF